MAPMPGTPKWQKSSYNICNSNCKGNRLPTGKTWEKRPVRPPETEGIYPPGLRRQILTLQQVMAKNWRCRLQFEICNILAE